MGTNRSHLVKLLTFIFLGWYNNQLAMFVHRHRYSNGFTTHFTIFYIFLNADAAINEQFNALTTIRAIYLNCLNRIHRQAQEYIYTRSIKLTEKIPLAYFDTIMTQDVKGRRYMEIEMRHGKIQQKLHPLKI